jgi:hypothetical protein
MEKMEGKHISPKENDLEHKRNKEREEDKKDNEVKEEEEKDREKDKEYKTKEADKKEKRAKCDLKEIAKYFKSKNQIQRKEKELFKREKKS